MAASKISIYSLGDLKTTLDDHIPIYLSASNTPSNQPLPKAQRFTPSHTTTYIRLGLGYSAVAIAVYLFYLDYVKKVEFVNIKPLTTYAVVGYFILNTALTLWTWFGEKGEVFAGSRFAKGKTTSLRVRSLAPKRKYDPVYRVSATWEAFGDETKHVEKTVPFTKFFSEDGVFAHAEFEAWLREELPVIGGPIATISPPTAIETSTLIAPVQEKTVSKDSLMEDDDIVMVGGEEDIPLAAGIAGSGKAKKRSKKKA